MRALPPRYPVLLALCLVACDRSGPSLTPSAVTTLPGVAQEVRPKGLSGEVHWTVSGGRLIEDGDRVRFVAPAEAGVYVVTAEAGRRTASASITVPSIASIPLTTTASPGGGIAGQRGNIAFEAGLSEDGAGYARFAIGADVTHPDVEVRVDDEGHGVVTFDGVSFDGEGALTTREETALRELAQGELGVALAMIPLDAGCLDVDLSPRALAALLMPWQAIQKYLTADRPLQSAAFARAAACRYFRDASTLLTDTRPRAHYPLLENGRVLPMAFGHLPFDAEGALPVSLAKGLGADVNVFGPGGSMCRGACGADCEENNCGQPEEQWRCVTDDRGRNTGDKQRWLRYTCGEHPGCIEHDGCFDTCNLVFGVGAMESFLCMRGCDLQAANGYGAGQGIDWAQGYGPYTHEKSYDYSQGAPVHDEALCPIGLVFVAIPGSGLAPHATVLHWQGMDTSTGPERCHLDLGDGSPVVVLDPCPATGDYAHTYDVPSELREATGVYTASLTLVGAQVEVTTDVQATWTFTASPDNGFAPLATQFAWQGFSAVTAALTCTIDFGDGSPLETIEDCAHAQPVAHTYANVGVYAATLTVNGADRPASKTLAIEVREDPPLADCSGIRDIPSWNATGSYSYSAAASQGFLSLTVETSGGMQGTLVKYFESATSIGFYSAAPSGTLAYHSVTLSSAPNAQNPYDEVTCNGPPVPPSGELDGGSNILLVFDLVNCRYNLHFQGLVAGSRHSGSAAPSATAVWATTFSTAWRPIPSSLDLSHSASYPAHSDTWILDAPELTDWYSPSETDLVSWLGEAGLGAAPVSWHITPNP